MAMFLRLVACILLMGAATAARADTLRPGYLALTQTSADHWQMVWRVPIRGGIGPHARPILPDNCAISGPVHRTREAEAVVVRADVACRGPIAGGRVGIADLSSNSADILVRIAPLRQPTEALRITPAHPVTHLPSAAENPGRLAVAATYFRIGIDHILEGYDHLLFVISLVLLVANGWAVVRAVTAFTIAHSLTLAGVTMGLFGLPQAPVEAVIALSILFLAVEIVKNDPAAPRLSQRLPWLVAFAFGLLHGFGFAGALREVGLPQGDVPLALVAFNLGVEAGQIAVVAATLMLLWLLGRLRPHAVALSVRTATYAIGITAAYWLIERMLMA